ncbi:glycoside hydrolase family 2 [Romboutsia ilealis]|nr:glycoside hydrolase family 2 [Romboutsia ilealis]
MKYANIVIKIGYLINDLVNENKEGIIILDKLHYPRPQFIRGNWIDLNGEWEFAFDDEDKGQFEKSFMNNNFFDRKIIVPYSYHTKNSGIHLNEDHQIVWYKKDLKIDIKENKRYILNFGAVDYKCDIWIDENHIATHIGGHTPFTVDLTNHLKEDSTIYIRVEDRNLCIQPIGKQSWKKENFLCWYTRTVGIWQQVWIEEVGEIYLTDIKMTPQIDNASIDLDILISDDDKDVDLYGEVYFDGELINKFVTNFKSNRARLTVDVSSESPDFRLNFWTPNTPNLYDIKFKLCKNDKTLDYIDSYFGMRKVESIGRKIYLNNQEFYQKLILDQGYFKDGGLTATPEELKDDVLKIKEMGFNGARKHQKIEDNRFMYLCDTLGLVMWAEMPSTFEYSNKTNENITKELYSFIDKHYNNPSVIVYTLLNESWGINEVYSDKKQQNFVNALVYLTKSLDNSRLVVGNDGWEHTISDILTIHDYNSDKDTMAKSYENIDEATNGSPSKTSTRRCYSEGYKYNNGPIMISEYGGVAYNTNKDDTEESWGYGERLNSMDSVINKIEELTKVVMDINDVCGFCYTQLSDVEQEINGLLDHNHQYKFDPKKIREILEYNHNLGFIFK